MSFFLYSQIREIKSSRALSYMYVYRTLKKKKKNFAVGNLLFLTQLPSHKMGENSDSYSLHLKENRWDKSEC